jgi:hypothetical protein
VLAVSAGCGSQSHRAAVSLTDGQTRWFLPGVLEDGETVACVARGHTARAKVPAPTISSGTEMFAVPGGASLVIERRPNGAAHITCGPASIAAHRRPTMPYVIGQNGVGLIRGANRFSDLKRLYGAPSSVLHCTAVWSTIGLRAVLGTRPNSCAGDPAVTRALATDPRWSTLNGTRVGDSVPRMRWQEPDAMDVGHGPVGGSRDAWLLATAHHKSGRSELHALSNRNRIEALQYSAD